jgi:hypothetical protein
MNSLISTQRRNYIGDLMNMIKRDRGWNSVECGVLDVKFYEESNNSDLLPSNIISSLGDASGVIGSYNQLDRNRMVKSATTENPSVVKLDQQIASVKSTVVESLCD